MLRRVSFLPRVYRLVNRLTVPMISLRLFGLTVLGIEWPEAKI